MKSIILKNELEIMHGTRGTGISKKYAVNGNHYSSLKAAINAAKGTPRNLVHVMATNQNVKFKTVATITRENGFFEVVIW
jgi:hypothetical protein